MRGISSELTYSHKCTMECVGDDPSSLSLIACPANTYEQKVSPTIASHLPFVGY